MSHRGMRTFPPHSNDHLESLIKFDPVPPPASKTATWIIVTSSSICVPDLPRVDRGSPDEVPRGPRCRAPVQTRALQKVLRRDVLHRHDGTRDSVLQPLPGARDHQPRNRRKGGEQGHDVDDSGVQPDAGCEKVDERLVVPKCGGHARIKRIRKPCEHPSPNMRPSCFFVVAVRVDCQTLVKCGSEI